MNTTTFYDIALGALSDVQRLERFEDMARRNWRKSQGNEAELYPYYNERIRRRCNCEVDGIGSGNVRNRRLTLDCLVDIAGAIYGVELKGPSKGRAYMKTAFTADVVKLRDLLSKGDIVYGVAIAMYLEKGNPSKTYDRVFRIGGEDVGLFTEVENVGSLRPWEEGVCGD